MVQDDCGPLALLHAASGSGLSVSERRCRPCLSPFWLAHRLASDGDSDCPRRSRVADWVGGVGSRLRVVRRSYRWVPPGILGNPGCSQQLGRLHGYWTPRRCNATERPGRRGTLLGSIRGCTSSAWTHHGRGAATNRARARLCAVARVPDSLCVRRCSTLRGLGSWTQRMDPTSLDWLRALSEHEFCCSRAQQNNSGRCVSLPRLSTGRSHVAMDDGICASLRRSPARDWHLLPSHHPFCVSDFFHGVDGLEDARGISQVSLCHTFCCRECCVGGCLFVDGPGTHRRRSWIPRDASPRTSATGRSRWRGCSGPCVRDVEGWIGTIS